MKLVDLVLTVQMLELPHPAFSGGVDLERLVGGAMKVEEYFRGPGEDHDGDQERNDRPGQLEGNRPVDARANLQRIVGTVLRGEVDDRDGREDAEECGYRDDEEVQRVDIGRER